MNIEEEKKGRVTSEQLGQRIIDFVQGAEFGSPQFLAASDYFELQRLQSHLRAEQKNLREDEGSESKLSWESAVRVTEVKIALREHEISQREYTTKGYGRAYTRIASWLESTLPMETYKEAEEKFPGDNDQQVRHRKDIYDRIYDTAEDAVFRKWDEDSSS